MSTISPQDSDRLLKNKITGFLISLQDKLLELKPKLMCSGCGRAAANRKSTSSVTPLLKIVDQISVSQLQYESLEQPQKYIS